MIKAFIFVKALKSESYFDDSFKLLEIEKNKYPIMAKTKITNIRLFSKKFSHIQYLFYDI